MKYLLISRENSKFKDYCYACKENVVNENLYVNGGTLQVPDAVFYSNILIIACEEIEESKTIVGFIALHEQGDSIYVNQIGVKNIFKRQGIGKTLVEKTKLYANERNVACHVRSFNIASQRLFESCGFIKDVEGSNVNNYFYIYKVKNRMENKGLDNVDRLQYKMFNRKLQ